MESCSFFSSRRSSPMLSLCLLILSSFFRLTSAYKPLSDTFLQTISSGNSDFDPNSGALLSPILIPRGTGTAGHSTVQHHFVNFFTTQLPKWKLDWYNSTSKTTTGSKVPVANLVFQREPPWTKQGQANWLTLAAHYDSKNVPEGFVGAMDSAVPCALLMHIARSIDQYVTQMHDEMAELGEGGTVEMDMGVQIVFLDGKEAIDGKEAALYGSRSLTKTWETMTNPAGSKYPNALSQISMFVLLDVLGSAEPTVPSYLPITDWAYNNMANLEHRLHNLDLLETLPLSPFLSDSNGTAEQIEVVDDYVPFMDGGIPFLHILPSPLPESYGTVNDNGTNLDMPTVRDWAKIMTGFALEWLDMMEVWPDK